MAVYISLGFSFQLQKVLPWVLVNKFVNVGEVLRRWKELFVSEILLLIMVVRLIIHFHSTSIQPVQNWKLVVLNWLTCSIWPCQENQWDTHEYSPMQIAILKVRQSSIFIVSGYRENGWIFNTWQHLSIIKCTWPSKFWTYILALT